MINITLNNTIKSFDKVAISGLELIQSLTEELDDKIVGIQIKDKEYDLSHVIARDCVVKIITTQDLQGLQILRHSAAHIMAQAVKELYPDAQITIGPVIEHGFYYDFAVQKPFTTQDLLKIEAGMQQIVARNEMIVREEWSREKAITYFRSIGETYKVAIIAEIPIEEVITVYRQGDFIDLCRGPHLSNTKLLKAFKLLKVAGAYWRGAAQNTQLQRIYGTAWASEQDLQDYLWCLEEAEKRDHRKLGSVMDLFHLQEEAKGQIFWHANGWQLYSTLQTYMREKLSNNGYIEVNTPILVSKKLWEKSGHWEKFYDNMFVTKIDEQDIAIKPMNCPGHVQIFKQGIKSYRDLPIRMAEFGLCHRNEPSGSLHGLMRVRGFTQDDAHIFCTEAQINSETVEFCTLLQEVYKELGFTDLVVKFADRPKIRAGTNETWDRAENALKKAIDLVGLQYSLNSGEGAFYGPKLEFVLRDALKREWQCGTLQLDFVLPERLEAVYIDEQGKKCFPVMIHRAILGTLERFIGILLEHYSGKLPLWLAPIQVVVATITAESNSYAQRIHDILHKNKLRVRLDLRNEQINYKIREHSMKKIPLIWIIGKKEVANNTISVRELGCVKQKVLPSQQAIMSLLEIISNL